MDPIAWQIISEMKGKDLAGFLGLVGCVALVVAGIPTLLVGLGKSAVKNALAVLRFLDGAVLVFGPAILLAPLFLASSRSAIIAGLLYMSMLLLRLFMARPEGTGATVFRVVSPWVLGVCSSLLSWALNGAPQFANNLVNIGLEIALISYVSFWVAFPTFFFARSSLGEQRQRFKQIPALYIFGLMVILGAELFGLYTCYYAWLGSRPPYASGLSSLVTLLAIGVQVTNEVRAQFKQYRDLGWDERWGVTTPARAAPRYEAVDYPGKSTSSCGPVQSSSNLRSLSPKS